MVKIVFIFTQVSETQKTRESEEEDDEEDKRNVGQLISCTSYLLRSDAGQWVASLDQFKDVVNYRAL